MESSTKIGRVFTSMLCQCPMEIANYAKCITLHKDNIEKGNCDKDFQMLKSFFRKLVTLVDLR
eukprot:gene13472-28542_t